MVFHFAILQAQLSIFASNYILVHDFLTLTWDVSKGFGVFGANIRFYQLFFAAGFFVGFYIMNGFFKKEGVPKEVLDSLLSYMVIATILGARLGHVFFYQWDYYSENPIEILKVWKGGLASHGAAIAIIITLYYFSKKITHKSPLWILDKVVITVALAACFIRLGNMFNSEIYGNMANSPTETVFVDLSREALSNYWEEDITKIDFNKTSERLQTDSLEYPVYLMTTELTSGMSEDKANEIIQNQAAYLNMFPNEEKNIIVEDPSNYKLQFVNNHWIAQRSVLGIPRHPTQLYESFAYLLIFILLYGLYQKGYWKKQGLLFGLFLITLFGFRFFIEFFKVVQVASEKGLDLNFGQRLSIPLILVGLFFVIRSFKIAPLK
jgi:phosphatidylglycerol---prolipoprotein diacylglyceryl transferase